MVSQVLPQADESSFEQLIAGPSPVMVEFYSPTCPHCRRIAPAIEALARDYAGRIAVVQVNALENMGLAQRFGVRGVPTMIFFVNGQPIDQVIGEVSQEELTQHFDQVLARVPQAG